MTARDEYHRPATLDWLKRYDIPCDNLLMRPSDDNRYDDEVKLDLFERNYKKEDVWFVLEDRQMVVNMWRSLGLTLFTTSSRRILMGIRIINNDIEIDGEKVARIFDVRPTLKDRLIQLIENADEHEEEIQKAYERGKEDAQYDE